MTPAIQTVPAYRAADAVLAIAIGLLSAGLTALPHLLAYARTGSLVWAADHDEYDFYLPLGGRAYFEHPLSVADPTRPDGATYYKSLPVAPGVGAARLLGAGPFLVGFAWRSVGGFLVGVAWFLFLRMFLGTRGSALGAAFLVADATSVYFQPGYATAQLVLRHLMFQGGTELPGTLYGMAAPQLRILNPVTSLPWWLLYLGLLTAAVQRPAWWRVLAAGAVLGLLFHVYFYLWTAAGIGLMAAIAIDRRRFWVYSATGLVGLAIGLPALIEGARFTAAHGTDWMTRTDKFLPVSRFDVPVPKLTVLLAVVTWVWVFTRARELIPVAAAGTAGLALRLHTFVTGVEVENFHWGFAYGPALSAAFVVAAAGLPVFVRLSRFGRAASWVVAGTAAAVSAWLFLTAIDRCAETQQINARLSDFQDHAATCGPLTHGAVIAGDPWFVSASATAFDLRPLAGYAAYLAPISDRELDDRLALNAALLGRTRPEYAAEQRDALLTATWGPWARSRDILEAKFADRMIAWDSVVSDRVAAEARFSVQYVAIPTGDASEHLADHWRIAQTSSRWAVWKRLPE